MIFFLIIYLDLGGIEVDADAAAEGGTGEGGGELGAEGTRATMGLGDATPDGAGVAAADGSLGATDTALLLVAVVDEAAALALVEFGVSLGVDVVNAEDGGVFALMVQTAAEGGEGRLHEEAGAGAAAGDLLLLGLEDINLAGAVDVTLGEVGGALNAALRLLENGHFELFLKWFLKFVVKTLLRILKNIKKVCCMIHVVSFLKNEYLLLKTRRGKKK